MISLLIFFNLSYLSIVSIKFYKISTKNKSANILPEKNIENKSFTQKIKIKSIELDLPNDKYNDHVTKNCLNSNDSNLISNFQKKDLVKNINHSFSGDHEKKDLNEIKRKFLKSNLSGKLKELKKYDKTIKKEKQENDTQKEVEIEVEKDKLDMKEKENAYLEQEENEVEAHAENEAEYEAEADNETEEDEAEEDEDEDETKAEVEDEDETKAEVEDEDETKKMK